MYLRSGMRKRRDVNLAALLVMWDRAHRERVNEGNARVERVHEDTRRWCEIVMAFDWLRLFYITINAVSKIGKIVTGWTNKMRLSFTALSDVYRPFIPHNLNLLSTVLFSWVQSSAPQELLNPLSKAVPGNITGLADIVNVTIYKTEPIVTGLGFCKLS